MIADMNTEQDSFSFRERRATMKPKAGAFPDYYAFESIGCFNIANGILSTGMFTSNTSLYRNDLSCFNKCGSPKYFALGMK